MAAVDDRLRIDRRHFLAAREVAIPESRFDLDWQADGSCLEHVDINFFPLQGEDCRDAKAICAGCLVRVECLQFAVDTGQWHGIWGGTSAEERRRLRKLR